MKSGDSLVDGGIDVSPVGRDGGDACRERVADRDESQALRAVLQDHVVHRAEDRRHATGGEGADGRREGGTHLERTGEVESERGEG